MPGPTLLVQPTGGGGGVGVGAGVAAGGGVGVGPGTGGAPSPSVVSRPATTSTVPSVAPEASTR